MNTHILCTNVKNMKKGNLFRVIINILSESELIFCSFTLDNTSPTTVNCVFFQRQLVCQSQATHLHDNASAENANIFPLPWCIDATTEEKKENLKMFSNKDLVFSTRIINFALLKWRLTSWRSWRNLEMSICSQVMGEQYVPKWLMKTVPL